MKGSKTMKKYTLLLSQFYNENTLNIFSDASIIGKTGNQTGCYGVVAVVEDNIIDSTYRLVSNTTNNNSEVKGIRAALDLAIKYKDNYKFINIFSDSLISVNGLREYIFNWKYNESDGLLYSSMNKPVVNQEVFIEARNMLDILEKSKCIIRIYHQSGHVSNAYSDIVEAGECFKKCNNINANIDLNLIRYISVWNNYVDNTSRGLLKRNKKNKTEYIDPIQFFRR